MIQCPFSSEHASRGTVSLCHGKQQMTGRLTYNGVLEQLSEVVDVLP